MMADSRRSWRNERPASISVRERQTIERTFEILVPMLGGGVALEADEARRHIKRPDAITPVRGATVRGHLRHWWRILYGVSSTSIAEMRARETALWGAASTPGNVSIHLEHPRFSLQEVEVFDSKPNSASTAWNARAKPDMEAVAYGAFPLQHSGNRPVQTDNGTLTRVGGDIRLSLTFGGGEADRTALANTVDAWLAFGGLGGRTRRGFGAVSHQAGVDAEALFLRLQRELPEPLLQLPAFKGGTAKFSDAQGDAMSALKYGLKRLKDFRQGPGLGRNPGQQQNKPGRSRWPEPDTIRRITNEADSPNHNPTHPVRGFPRAVFGMPIIFHFQSKRDPGDTMLVPDGADRLASPLRLSVYRDLGGKYRATALVLRQPAIPAVRLTRGGNTLASDLTTKLSAIEAGQVTPLSGHTDVLGEFLKRF